MGCYLNAKKREKPAVAAIIVNEIRRNGGRFLKRCDVDQGEILWIDIGDMRAREKTCQALLEGAPAIRRQQKVAHSDKNEENKTKVEEELPSKTDELKNT